MLKIMINSVVCVCAVAGFIMGAVKFFRKKKPLYSQMVTVALGCAALGRLYNISVMICGNGIPKTFNTGILATIGFSMFIFGANYGEMDSLCDMNFKRNKKLKWAALAVPALLIITAAVIFAGSSGSMVLRITYCAEILFIASASYYNFKHLCTQDIELGIIGSLRKYNMLTLMLELLYTAEIALDAFELTNIKSVVYGLMSGCMLMIIPVLDKGMSKWKTGKPIKKARSAANGN